MDEHNEPTFNDEFSQPEVAPGGAGIGDPAGAKAAKRKFDPRARRGLIIAASVILVGIVVFAISLGGRKSAPVASTTYVTAQNGSNPGVPSQEDLALARAEEQRRVAAAAAAHQTGIEQPINGAGGLDTTPNATTVVIPPQNGTVVVQGANGAPGATAVAAQQANNQNYDQARERKLAAVEHQMNAMVNAWGLDGGAARVQTNYVFQPKNAEGTKATTDDSVDKALAATDGQAVVAEAYKPFAAQLISPINTDVPGIIRASILTGPLKGYVVAGKAKRQDEYATVEFTMARFHGKNFKINAIAVDENTELDALSGEYNGKYTQRFLFPIVAAGVSAFATAKAQTGNQLVVSSPSSGGTSAGGFGAIQTPAPSTSQAEAAMLAAGAQQAQTLLTANPPQPQVVVDMKSTFGIMFVDPVIESDIPSDNAGPGNSGEPNVPAGKPTPGSARAIGNAMAMQGTPAQ
jgi:hypothetical protein